MRERMTDGCLIQGRKTTDGWIMDEWMGGWLAGWIGGWMDGRWMENG